MKNFVITFTSICVSLFLYTFLTILAAACHRGGDSTDPTPDPDGWNNTTFEPLNEALDGDYALTGSFCGQGPENLMLSVWYFPKETAPSVAVRSLTDPGVDEDGEPVEPELPAETYDAWVKVNRNAVDYSSYDKSGKLTVYLEPDSLAVIQVTNEAGKSIWLTKVTTGNKGDLCFTF